MKIIEKNTLVSQILTVEFREVTNRNDFKNGIEEIDYESHPIIYEYLSISAENYY
jgi:hypothetical protein